MEANRNKSANNGSQVSQPSQQLNTQDERDIPAFERVPVEVFVNKLSKSVTLSTQNINLCILTNIF